MPPPRSINKKKGNEKMKFGVSSYSFSKYIMQTKCDYFKICDIAKEIGYDGIVKARAVFGDESDDVLGGVIYIHPDQEQTIRLDPNFMDKNKYGGDLMMTGAIGKIAGLEVKKSKRVKLNDAKTGYINPIVLLSVADANEDPAADATATDAPALTIYMKRNVQLESDRDILRKTTVLTVDEHYGVALSNDSKVVVATFKK